MIKSGILLSPKQKYTKQANIMYKIHSMPTPNKETFLSLLWVGNNNSFLNTSVNGYT